MPKSMSRTAWRNAATFGPGTLGRDMVYTFVSLYLVYFLTEIIHPSDTTIWLTTVVMLSARLFDAFVDFVMASVVERTRSRWGQFKPWIALGVVLSAIATVFLFNDRPHFDGIAFTISFGVTYLIWGFAWSMNDISYWSLLPALSVEHRERELIGSVAKVIGTIGLFAVAIGVFPIASALQSHGINARMAWFQIAVALAVIMVLTQCITLVGVRQPPGIAQVQSDTLRQIFPVLRRNDQVLWTGVCMILFMTGFQTTTTFGPYYFKYVWGDPGVYPLFAGTAGVAQLIGYAVYPVIGRRLPRQTLFTAACCLIFAGYVAFLFIPRVFPLLAAVGFVIFFGQALIVLMTILMLADTIDYGQWRTGERHDAITFAIQPFIYKASAALAMAVVSTSTVVTGITHATGDVVSARAQWGIRLAMLVLPLVLMVVGYLLLRRNFRIDEAFHARIIRELRERGDLATEPTA